VAKKKKINSPAKPKPEQFIHKQASTSIFLNRNFWLAVSPLLAFLLYANTLQHGFVLDDIAVITQNKIVQKGFGGFGEILKTYYWAGYWDNYSGLYRPVSLLLFATEWQFFKDASTAYHVVNVLLYALSAFLLLRFLFKLFPTEKIILPVVAVLIFIFNPMHTEVVANIKSADELLCFIFFLLSAEWLLKSATSGKLSHGLISGSFIFLSLMSKEGGLLFLPVLGLMLYMFRNVPVKKIVRMLLPHLCFLAIWLLIHYVVVSNGPKEASYTFRDNALLASDNFFIQRFTAIGMLGRYIVKSVIPYQFSYDYSFSEIPNTGLASAWPAIGLLLSAILLFIAIRQFNKNRIVSFGILFFFITISLTSNIFRIIGATMADRFLFVPSLGAALILAYGVAKLSSRTKNAYTPALLTIPLLVFYSFRTIDRNRDWKTQDILFTKDVNTVPGSSRAHTNYASVLYSKVQNETVPEEEKTQVLNECIQHFSKATEISPLEYPSWSGLGVAYYKNKNYPEAVNAFRTAVQLNANDSTDIQNLGNSFYKTNQFDSSIYYHELAIRKNSFTRETWNYLGGAWFSKKNYPKAIEAFRQGIKFDSLFDELWLNLGNALAMNGQYNEAISAFKNSYRLNNAQANSIYFIALTYQNMGMPDSTKKYLAIYEKMKTGK
jgi:protein O-mannosyl-transferase